MVMKFVLPEEMRSMDEMDAICSYKENKYPWPPIPLLKLIKEGWEAKYFTNFPWDQYAEDSQSPIKAIYGKIANEMEKTYPDQEDLKKWLDEVLARGETMEHRLLEMADLAKMYHDGWYLIVALNIKSIKGEKGIEPRCVAITGMDDNSISFHDPGPDGKSNHKVGCDLFLKSWRYPGEQGEAIALRQSIAPIVAELES